jgi:hypothetical protein
MKNDQLFLTMVTSNSTTDPVPVDKPSTNSVATFQEKLQQVSASFTTSMKDLSESFLTKKEDIPGETPTETPDVSKTAAFRGSVAAFCAAFKTKLTKAPKWAYTVAALCLGLLIAAVTFPLLLKREHPHSVAFVGNRVLAINDLPRVLEALSNNLWTQDSCLHTRGSLATITETGNGMYGMWNGKENAYLEDQGVYDYGACTLHMLFQGKDDQLVYQNMNGAYYDDGRNPCFQDDSYYQWTLAHQSNATKYDIVVLSDHPKRMAVSAARQNTISELQTTYSTYLSNSNLAIIVAPNGFESDQTNMTGLGTLGQFTSLIHQGALQYANAVTNVKTRVAPVGIAFLVVYEEDHDLWSKLTDADDIHPSVYGTYLTACVIYATATNRMPPLEADSVKSYFKRSRSISGNSYGYPSEEEAEYLWQVAQRVVEKRHKPSSFIKLSADDEDYVFQDATDDAASGNQ